MSCSRSRIFFSNSFSWVSLEKTVAPFSMSSAFHFTMVLGWTL
jgi:hypothetical protein